MVDFTDFMPHTITYWEPGTPDGYGGLDFSAVTPVTIEGRWQKVSQLFRDDNKREVLSNAIVYTEQAVGMRGYLGFGDLTGSGDTDPREIEGLYEIRQVGFSDDIEGSLRLHKVWL